MFGRIAGCPAQILHQRLAGVHSNTELESVLTADEFSNATEKFLKDPFTDGELAYESSRDGFILSSVGPTMVQNESGIEETSTSDVDFDPQGSDDDHIWRWPPRE